MTALLWVIMAILVIGFHTIYRRLNSIQMALDLIKTELKIDGMHPTKR
ncbi:MAG: hypothetical protein ABSC55_21945 [Syntrophorhabdales bacterium]|jgi:hypothetical protein